jgi:hypothetical protein
MGEKGNNEMWLTIVGRYVWHCCGIRGSVLVALALLAFDVAESGHYLLSLLVCPVWFCISVLKNAIQRPGWRLATVRIAIPPLILGLAMANEAVQYRIGKANVSQIIAACEEFHTATGAFPKKLDELVPRYLPSIPRAKYCLALGEFMYLNYGHPMLVWYVVPPFGRKIYDFDERRWGYLD